MIFKTIVVGQLEVNCFILACEETREGIVVDPGDSTDEILNIVQENEIKVVEIIATHGHFDHIGSASSLQKATGAPFAVHKADEPMVEALVDIAAFFGLQTDEAPKINRFFDEGDTITFGNKTLNILHVPGHAPGNVAFTWPGHAIVGDTVFAGSIGRTDFENSDHQTLIESIHNKILTLPEDTILHPGHGPDTTVAQEKRLNPFLI